MPFPAAMHRPHPRCCCRRRCDCCTFSWTCAKRTAAPFLRNWYTRPPLMRLRPLAAAACLSWRHSTRGLPVRVDVVAMAPAEERTHGMGKRAPRASAWSTSSRWHAGGKAAASVERHLDLVGAVALALGCVCGGEGGQKWLPGHGFVALGLPGTVISWWGVYFRLLRSYVRSSYSNSTYVRTYVRT